MVRVFNCCLLSGDKTFLRNRFVSIHPRVVSYTLQTLTSTCEPSDAIRNLRLACRTHKQSNLQNSFLHKTNRKLYRKHLNECCWKLAPLVLLKITKMLNDKQKICLTVSFFVLNLIWSLETYLLSSSAKTIASASLIPHRSS